MDSTVLHIIDDLRKASPVELIAYSVAGPKVVEKAPEDVDAYDWAIAGVVLVEADACARLVNNRLLHRSHVALIGHDPREPHLWIRACQIGAEHVVFLPQATAWLVEEIRTGCRLQATRSAVGEPKHN
jgi:hypothetical protein